VSAVLSVVNILRYDLGERVRGCVYDWCAGESPGVRVGCGEPEPSSHSYPLSRHGFLAEQPTTVSLFRVLS
jgi:hypothetical protein